MSQFLFVDRILRLNEDGSSCGVAHITADHPYLFEDAAANWQLMPSIIGETLGQLCAWHAMQRLDFSHRPVAGIVPNVEMCGPVYLGDTLVLNAYIDDLSIERLNYHAVATVNAQPVFYIHEALGPLVPMRDLIDPLLAKQQFATLYRPGELDECTENAQTKLAIQPQRVMHLSFDRIVDWQTGTKAIAQKKISGLSPFFIDHFPNKPVLPLTLLLQCKLDLAMRFLRDMLGEEEAKRFKPKCIKRTKMNEFVCPGDTVTTTLSVKPMSEAQYDFVFRTEVAGKRVCIAQAEFHGCD